MPPIDAYTEAYSQKLSELPGYMQKKVRTTIKVVSLVAIAAMITVASIGPSLRFVTLRRAIGFSASAVSIVALQQYLSRTRFYFLDHIEENRGFFYEVKDAEGTLKAYLLGAVHLINRKWAGLTPPITNAIDNSGAVYVEAIYPPQKWNFMAWMLGLKLGIDFKVMDYTRTLYPKTTLNQLETPEQQVDLALRYLSETGLSQLVGNPNKMLFAWKKGDSKLIEEEIGGIPDYMLENRNAKWMTTLQEVIPNSSKPIFIAVGAAHLFTATNGNATGLIDRFQTLGYTVNRLEA